MEENVHELGGIVMFSLVETRNACVKRHTQRNKLCCLKALCKKGETVHLQRKLRCSTYTTKI